MEHLVGKGDHRGRVSVHFGGLEQGQGWQAILGLTVKACYAKLRSLGL